MDDDKPFQPKNISKTAELFMECEEEELEPWQKKVEETQDEDDDELIFVGEISSSKPAISNILNRGHSSSSSKGIKSEPHSPGIPKIFRTASQRCRDPPSTPVAASPRFHLVSKSSQSSVTVENASKPDFTKNSQVGSDNSSILLFDSTQESLSPSQDIPAIFREGMKNTSYVLKHPSTSKVNSVTPKKPKTSEDVPQINPPTSLPLTGSPPVTSSKVMLSKGTNTSPPYDAGADYLRACPKCNVQFNLLDPLKYHMKRCCPDMITKFLGVIVKSERPCDEDKTDSETGRLIMLVNEFYYGRHEGVTEKEPKTYTTFKCFSCSKVLKNNIRFMNHMKHHLELEKQNSESWENHTTCQHCYRQYPTPFQLQCHIESTHTPHEFSTICKICELSFETEHILLQHMKDTHKPGEMPYVCQKKGVHRCPKCRLQFLTRKEKAEHKAQHRTFIKPKELEGLPPGAKVTIRASLGPLQSKLPTASFGCAPGTSFLQVTPPTSQNTTAKNPRKSNASRSKTSKPHATTSTASKANTSKPRRRIATSKPHATTSTASKANTSKPRRRIAKCKAKPSYKQKRQRNRKNKMSLALKNIRCRRGIHKCIECHSKIKDFASHFSIYIRCSFCKYNTNCNKAFVNHMMSSHSNHPGKRFCIFKKHSGTLRGITLVCLKCDFLADSSGLDRMAKHLSQRKTHTCQVIIENVSKSTSTSEPTTGCSLK
ncbi:ZNF280C isoform 1 [Pan troglodytes]|uniref:ZNF280C isoform 1 n=1 Tax=Pan troglodytes TaxID=9598 RepID=A0A2J8JBC0_PANTR|nr:zinc finger protein 280C isoform X2 [Pan troglodytes]PNI20068.1 ZNF280C isoform 1 [Pan troglodytes]